MTIPASEIENPAEFKSDTSDSVSPAPRSLRSRFIFFVTVILSVLLAANWFVCATWNHFSGMTAAPAWEIIFPGLTLMFVATTFLSLRYSSFGLRLVYRIAKLQSLQPDAVFISGDLFDGPQANPDALVEPWKKLSVPAGIYYVTGNHEEFTDRTNLIDAVQRTGIRVLNKEKVDIHGLQIVGVHDREAGDPRQFRTLLRQAGLNGSRPSILLTHRPSNLAIAEEEGVSLQLSGHTHGGQIWPWTWVAARVHRRFNYGFNRFGKLLVYTSSGAGTWGVPMRVGTKSEIVFIHLKGQRM